MSRLFITERELEFISKLNKELIQGIVGQEVLYYAISKELTQAHDLYNEAIEKVWYHPVRVNARVEFDNPSTESGGGTLDSKYTLIASFHRDELIDRNLRPREGDFIEFKQIVWEITSVTEPQLVYGQPNASIMTKCFCVPSREGQFQMNSDASRFVDNTHPVDDSEC